MQNSTISSFYVSATNEGMLNMAESAVDSFLLEKTGDEDSYTITNQSDIADSVSDVTNSMTYMIGGIAGISLLVGGIGIMNIMYVSDTERTREIGLRMSIGAKGRHILFQFLIEAVIISVTGGIIGVVLGIGSSLIIKYAIGWPIYIQMYSVVLSFLVCTVTGIFFGWYPAQKASQLNPIDAIRYE